MAKKPKLPPCTPYLETALLLTQCAPDAIVEYEWIKVMHTAAGEKYLRSHVFECFHHLACRLLFNGCASEKILREAQEGNYRREAIVQAIPKVSWWRGVVHIWPNDERYATKCSECHRKRGTGSARVVYGARWKERTRYHKPAKRRSRT